MAEKKMPSIALVFGHAKPGNESEAENADAGEGNEEGKVAAGEDMLAAIKANDAAGLASAVSNLVAILESEPHDEGGED